MKDSQMRMADTVKEFTRSTTTHGIPNVMSSKGYFKKGLWLIVTICATAGLGYNLYEITRLYLSRPVYVKVEEQHSSQMTFPAVTVCNTNPVKRSTMYDNIRLQYLMARWGLDPSQKRRRKRDIDCTVQDSSGTCYWVTSISGSRAEAATECVDDGGELAVVDSLNVTNSIVNSGIVTSDLWIDLEYNTGDSLYYWQNTILLDYANWESGFVPGSSFATSNPCVRMRTAGWVGTNCLGAMVFGMVQSTFLGLCQGTASSGSQDTTTQQQTTTVQDTTTTQQVTTTVQPTTTIQLTTTVQPTTTIPTTTTVLGTTTTQPDITTHSDLTTTTQPNTTTTDTPTVIGATSTQSSDSGLTETTHIETMATSPITTSAAASTASSLTTEGPEFTPQQYQSIYPEREPYTEEYLRESDLLTVLASMTEDEKKALGYNFPEMVINCQYEGQSCYEWQFGYMFDPVHGSCFVFNSGWNYSHPVYTSSRPGTRSGIKLLLNVKQDEYVQGIGNSGGVVVVVQRQNKMPFPEDEGVFGLPGTLTSIGVKKVEVIRLGGQYSTCSEDETDNSAKNVFSDHFNVDYSVIACEKTCYQKNVIDKCGCGDPQYPMTGTAIGSNHTVPCDYRNQSQDDCMYGLTLQYINNLLDCNCPNPCRDDFYTYSVTKVLWPTEKEATSTLNNHNTALNSTLSWSPNPEYFRRNLLQVEVFFEEFNYKRSQEFPKYPLLVYISDIGSIVGLWLGCSILTLLEFLQLGLDLILLTLKKLRHISKKSNTISTEKPNTRNCDVKSNSGEESSPKERDKLKTRDKDNIKRVKSESSELQKRSSVYRRRSSVQIAAAIVKQNQKRNSKAGPLVVWET